MDLILRGPSEVRMNEFEGGEGRICCFQGRLVEEGHQKLTPIESVMPLPNLDARIRQGCKCAARASVHRTRVLNKYSPTNTTDRCQVEGRQLVDVEF